MRMATQRSPPQTREVSAISKTPFLSRKVVVRRPTRMSTSLQSGCQLAILSRERRRIKAMGGGRRRKKLDHRGTPRAGKLPGWIRPAGISRPVQGGGVVKFMGVVLGDFPDMGGGEVPLPDPPHEPVKVPRQKTAQTLEIGHGNDHFPPKQATRPISSTARSG